MSAQYICFDPDWTTKEADRWWVFGFRLCPIVGCDADFVVGPEQSQGTYMVPSLKSASF